MIYLKQSTASQAVLLGPFVDSTDGVTAETGLTIANTDIRLSANGGNMFAKTSGGGTHDENGWYTITLDATDTATVGRLQISCVVSGALPVFMECHVLEESIYDALIGASAAGFDSNGRVDVGKVNGETASATDEVDFDDLASLVTAVATVDTVVDGIAASGNAFLVGDGYQGDITEDEPLYIQFFSYDSGGAPSTLSSATCNVYKDGSTTQTTTGPAISYDFDSVTGLNLITLTTTDAFYVTGSDYQIHVTGTVDGDTVHAVVATFSIQNRYSSGSGLDAAATRAALGLASANLDTQLSTIDTVVDGIKAKTDSLTFTEAGVVDANAAITSMGTGVITAASIAASALDGKGDWSTLTAQNVWQADLGSIVVTGNMAGKKVSDILVDTADLQANQGNWLTATGFSTHDAAAVVTALGTGSTLTAVGLATGAITAGSIAAGALDGKGDWVAVGTSYTYTNDTTADTEDVTITA